MYAVDCALKPPLHSLHREPPGHHVLGAERTTRSVQRAHGAPARAGGLKHAAQARGQAAPRAVRARRVRPRRARTRRAAATHRAARRRARRLARRMAAAARCCGRHQQRQRPICHSSLIARRLAHTAARVREREPRSAEGARTSFRGRCWPRPRRGGVSPSARPPQAEQARRELHHATLSAVRTPAGPPAAAQQQQVARASGFLVTSAPRQSAAAHGSGPHFFIA